jgi:hypothetical protein
MPKFVSALLAFAAVFIVPAAYAAERVTLGKEILGTWCSTGEVIANGHMRYHRDPNPLKGKAPCKGMSG